MDFERLTPAARCALARTEWVTGAALPLDVDLDVLLELHRYRLIVPDMPTSRVRLTSGGAATVALMIDDFFMAREWPCTG